MTTPRTNGAYLNELWNVGAAHALYIHDGHWYHPLKRFPGALFDLNGYVLFKTQEEFSAFRHGKIEKDFALPPPGISALPDYVRVVPDGGPSSPFAPPFWDVDIHGSSVALEGRRRLVVHLERERNQTIVRKKKKNATSLNCEICAFSFERAYGSAAGEYCEVHHLLEPRLLQRLLLLPAVSIERHDAITPKRTVDVSDIVAELNSKKPVQTRCQIFGVAIVLVCFLGIAMWRFLKTQKK